ncbi:MAG: tRNA (adenosine(37)-N6)-threonylcarbamoyltransferase complex transferase subunit TsaD [Desulfovibrio sp.]|nr:tRNA (adenosine(37)-N6)-threonylcarbamoyltransferase complex transferase subunit TsaD [Desulfovibrio sp.]
MLCLGIESSCDETALALVEDGKLVDAVLSSQAEMHALFGGVVPELASREHYRYLSTLYDELIRRAGISQQDIGLIAVTRGPGLLGSLLVGVAFAKGLALGLDKSLLGVNHLHAHLLAAGLEHEITYPALGILASGGHTNIYRIEQPWHFVQLGRTLDDAAGEALDKIGKLLGCAYPCGAFIDKLACLGHADDDLFPRPYLNNDNLNFSFSGLKTAAAQYVAHYLKGVQWPHPLHNVQDAPQRLLDFCASFTQALVDTLCVKINRALDGNADLKTLVLAGGVAANSLLRERVHYVMEKRGGKTIIPSTALCTDNAAMIAYTGWLLGRKGYVHNLMLKTIPRGEIIPDDMILSSVAHV